MERSYHTIGRVVAFHGCDFEIAKKLVNYDLRIAPSENDFDWLGGGAYFWVDSPQRAVEWAVWKSDRGIIKSPCVVGAFIHLGLCLSLADYGAMGDIKNAYARLKAIFEASGKPLPTNELKRDGIYLKRFLDCAVIDMVHFVRSAEGKPEYDTVLGVFEEGTPVFPGAGFKEKTHIQVAVRNPKCIIGYFQVQGYEIFR